MAYLLIPLDEAIVFPTVTATLPIDVGDEDRVFLLPRTDGEFARVGVVAEVLESGESRRGNPAATVLGLHRGLAGAAVAGEDDPETLHIEVQEFHDGHPDDEHTRELAREYRAVVEEILELRGDDGRISAFLRSVAGAGRAGRHGRAQPRILRRAETAPARHPRRHRAAPGRGRAAARAAGRAAGAQPHPRRRRVRRPETAARLLPAQTDGVDPQGAGRGRGQPDRGVRAQDRRGRDAGGGGRAGRQGAAPARAPGRAVARVLDDPQLPRLADRGAVGQALRGEARPRPHPRGARRRPRRPRRREAADHRVHRRPQAARGAGQGRGGQPRQRGDPDPGRASRAPARPRSASRSPVPSGASSSASASAASTTRPRSAATAAPISAPCRAGSSAPCATPRR